MLQIKDKCKLNAEEIKRELLLASAEYRAQSQKVEKSGWPDEERKVRAINFGENAAEVIDAFLLKIDPDLEAEEVKREIMYRIDELHLEGHLTMTTGSMSDEEKLKIIRYGANASAALCTFLTKIGVEIRTASGVMLWTSLKFFYWEQHLEIELMRKRRTAEGAI